MATCNDCLYHETCHGRIAYCMDIDEATGKEILDIEKRCKDFKNKADFVEVPCRCEECKCYETYYHMCNRTGHYVKMKCDDFCSYGERRKDDDL